MRNSDSFESVASRFSCFISFNAPSSSSSSSISIRSFDKDCANFVACCLSASCFLFASSCAARSAASTFFLSSSSHCSCASFSFRCHSSFSCLSLSSFSCLTLFPPLYILYITVTMPASHLSVLT